MDVAGDPPKNASSSSAPPKPAEQGELKRKIGPGLLLFFVLGDILGAGIYARVGSVAGATGGAMWTAFLLAIVLAALTACSYAELVTKFPGAAGAALYINKAFNLPFVTFMVAFAVLVSGVASAGAASRAFGGKYLAEFIELPALLVSAFFFLVIAAINFRGVSESVKVNLVLTLVELSGLLLIVVVGVVAFFNGSADLNRPFTFKAEGGGVGVPLAILGGAAIAFFAMIGFEDSVNMAEEAKEPSRIYPRALFGGLFLAGLLYLLVSFVASMVVPTEQLAKSSGPLLEVVKVGPLGIPPQLFSIIALIAISNTALINMVMASRVLYGMAKQGIIPRMLGKTHSERQTPWVAIIFTTVIALALVATGDLNELADTTVLLLLVVFTLVNVVVLVLRRETVEQDHFTAPTIVPVLGAIACLVLLTQQDFDIFLRAGVLLLIGAALWFVNIVIQRQLDKPEEASAQD